MEKTIDERIEENEKFIYYVIDRSFPQLTGDEDIIQIARIAVWEGICSYDEKKPDVKESTWISRCIKNVIIDEIRKRSAYKRKSELLLEGEQEVEDIIFDIDENLNKEDMMKKIEEYLDSTETKIMKRKSEGYGTDEIAKAIGISRRSVQRKLKHSREVLGNVLQ